MHRDDMINALTKAGYFFKWSKYSNEQLFRIYQQKIEHLKIIKKPVYTYFIQDYDGSFISTTNYKRYRQLCKQLNKKGFKLRTGETYETRKMDD